MSELARSLAGAAGFASSVNDLRSRPSVPAAKSLAIAREQEGGEEPNEICLEEHIPSLIWRSGVGPELCVRFLLTSFFTHPILDTFSCATDNRRVGGDS